MRQREGGAKTERQGRRGGKREKNKRREEGENKIEGEGGDEMDKNERSGVNEGAYLHTANCSIIIISAE